MAGVLIAAFFLQCLSASLIKSPAWDEPHYIAAGLANLQKGSFAPNRESPPLVKEIAAGSLLLTGVRLPDTPEAQAMLTERGGQALEWLVGNDVVTRGDPSTVMLRSRLPLIVLSSLTGLLLYIWGRQILGNSGAAVAALLLYAVDPTLIAHSELVSTDSGAAVFTLLFFFCLWKYLQRTALFGLLTSGVALGLCLCAKFSTAFMVPVALCLVLAGSDRFPGNSSRTRLHGMGVAAARFLAMAAVAALIIDAVYLSPAGVLRFWQGIGTVYSDHDPGYLAYMTGRTQKRFLTYFAVVWLLKEPIATVALVFLGSGIILLTPGWRALDKLFIFLPPAVLFTACTFGAADLGIRYLLPALPFACLAGGVSLSRLLQHRSIGMRLPGYVLCAWLAVATAGIYPDHLSYFNEAACMLRDPGKLGFDGGTRCGPWWFDDSNTDWGQGLEQLRRWRRDHPDSRTLHLAYFGSFPPEAYGIVSQGGVFDRIPAPGLYVISAKYIYRASPVLDPGWLIHATPRDIVGHALYVYDIR